MPVLDKQPVSEIHSPESSLSLTPSPTFSDQSINFITDSDSSVVIYPAFIYGPIPPEPHLRDLLIKASQTKDLINVTNVKLQAIATDVGLQHIHIHVPNLVDLNLDGSILSSLRDLGCSLNNLKVLRVSRCGLKSLDGVFGFESLEEFYASNNAIEDLSPCTFLPNLRHIDLKRNCIKDLTSVSILGLCTNLEHLELAENENLVRNPEYRRIIKGLLPELKTLDGTDLASDIPLVPFESYDNILETCSVVKENNNSTKPISTRYQSGKPSKIEQPYTVKFSPKVLSPRISSGNSSDSNLSTGFEYELLGNKHT